jgi:hypothetical protein
VLSSSSQDPRNPDVHRSLLDRDILLLHEGKTIHQFSDGWGERPLFCVPLANLRDKRNRLEASRFFRLGFRTVASSTNERSAIFTMVPPGCMASHSFVIESSPDARPYSSPLLLAALANTFPFDWLLRLAVSANITYNFLDPQPVPDFAPIQEFLAHAALRLVCNHAGYEPLWRDQLGNCWRECKTGPSWPVLEGERTRWELRAATDVILARCYGLDRRYYEYIVSSFDHSAQPFVPQLCLAKFEELAATGDVAFTKKYDPYWDVPLNSALPRPSIGFPGLEQPDHSSIDFSLSSPAAAPKRGRKR